MDKQRRKETEFENFENPALEGRRLFAEIWGTFLAVMVTVGTTVISAQTGGQIDYASMCLARGLIVTIIIYFMGGVSGAHLNPVVTLAFALRRNFPWYRVPGYIVAQMIGAFAAVVFIREMFGMAGQMGASIPGQGMTGGQAIVMEAVLTSGMITTILGTAYEGRNIGALGGIAVGGYITLASFLALKVSGASMNPLRSLAPDVVRGDYSTTWIYFAGPLVGMLIGVIFEALLRGAPGRESSRVAQGGHHF